MALTLKHSIQGVERGVIELIRSRLTTTLTEYNLAWDLLDNMPAAIADRAIVGSKEEIPVQSQDWIRVQVLKTLSSPLASIGETRDNYKVSIYCCTRSQVYKKVPSGASTANEPDKSNNTSQQIRCKSIAESVNRCFQKYGITDLSATYGVFNIKDGIYSDYKPRETNATGIKLEIELNTRGYDASL